MPLCNLVRNAHCAALRLLRLQVNGLHSLYTSTAPYKPALLGVEASRAQVLSYSKHFTLTCIGAWSDAKATRRDTGVMGLGFRG